MTSATDPIATLNTLLDTDPGLKTALREASDLGQFAQIATACAERHGMALNAGELLARIDQAAASNHPSGPLADQQLARVAGGGMHIDPLPPPWRPKYPE